MILNCNSCEKKFVVPDHAISAEGRVVQCGSCGNKWRQFPINNEANKINVEKRIDVKKTTKIPKLQKPKKKKQKKTFHKMLKNSFAEQSALYFYPGKVSVPKLIEN